MLLVTGVAGFVGMHVAKRFLDAGHSVVGVDAVNSYYDVSLKRDRLKLLNHPNFKFYEIDLVDAAAFNDVVRENRVDVVIHLAAQAGVRYSIENPVAYRDSNLSGFLTILEACRNNSVGHLLYASSSSVYGESKAGYFLESDFTDAPLSFYAATKKANELMAYSYSHLYGLSTTGLRFFSVYGEWGRPDMAYYKFAKKMIANEPIDVYNNGDMWRDFTYIDDVVESIFRLKEIGAITGAKVLNIGCGNPVRLGDMVSLLESYLGVPAKINFLPKPEADVSFTAANVDELRKLVAYAPQVSLEVGLRRFVDWFDSYHVR